MELTRAEYAALYGPTVGDQVRLATPICGSRSKRTYTFGGEEAVFGGGKSIRESMAQGMTTRAEGAPDTVITNVIVLDHWGIVRADVGIRDGRIVALGRSGNPDIADGVHPDLHDRTIDRRHLGRGQDPDGRRDRRTRPFPVSIAIARGPRDRASRPSAGAEPVRRKARRPRP